MNTPLISFLASLKFTVDAASASTFDKAVSSAKNSVLALGVALISTTKKVYDVENAWIESTAGSTLAIRRLGISSIQNFKAMEKAANAVGISVNDMFAGVENIQQMKFELGAGATSLFQLMNPKITEATDSGEVMNMMAQGAQQMKDRGVPTQEIAARAKAAGMDPTTARMMAQYGTLYKQQLELFRKDIGAGTDALSVEALGIKLQKEHNETMLEGKAVLSGAFKEVIDIQKELTDSAAKFNMTMTNDQAAMMFAADKVFGINQELIAALKSLNDTIREKLGMNPETPWQDQLKGGAMMGLGAAGIWAGIKAIPELVKGIPGVIELFTKVIAGEFGTGFLDKLEAIGAGLFGFGGGGLTAAESVMYKRILWGLAGTAAAGIGMLIYSGGVKADEGSGVIGDYNNKKDLGMRKMMEMGLSKEDAADRMANFMAESQLDPFAEGDKGKAYGIGQWHPDRQKNYEKLFGHSMRSVEDEFKAYQEQLAFSVWETQFDPNESKQWERAQAEHKSGSLYSRYIERPADIEGEAKKRGSMADQLKQEYANMKVDIHIHGSGDPDATANAVNDKLKETFKGRYQSQYGG